MQNISDNGIHFIAAWEQFRGTAYKATNNEQYWTIGYGHYGPDIKEGQKITEGQALILLQKDISYYDNAVSAVAHPSLNQSEFDAIVDLVFNNGLRAIAASTGIGKALRAGDIETLSHKLPQFIYQKGRPLLGLRRRATARLALFDGMPWQQAEKIGRDVS